MSSDRRDEVGLLEELGVDLFGVDELRDFDGFAGGQAEMLDLFRLDGDVLALGVFVALDDVGVFDRAFVGGDFLMADALAGSAADLMEADVALRVSCGEEADTE